MKYQGVCIAVSDVKLAREFYENLFGLEVFQDYGINISFTCGISLQQEFDWLLNIPGDRVLKKSHNMELYFEEDDFDGFLTKLKEYPSLEYMGKGVHEKTWGQRTIRFYDLDGHIIEVGENMKTVVKRFLATGMTMEETSKRMDVSVPDLEKLLSL
ncbi:VOC family protein [Oscillospiraceae bacterium MB08-C2-2]|nr:VOC family protein [Oscillospiraceae bacterium MB08-C2-2]